MIDIFPYEILISEKNNNLFCIKNDIISQKCIYPLNYFPLIKKNGLFNNYYNKKSLNLYLYPKSRLLYLNKLKQKIQTLNLISPKYNKYCKCYPKTIFFKNENNPILYNEISKNYTITKINITDKKYMVYSHITLDYKIHAVSILHLLKENNISSINDFYGPNLLYTDIDYETSKELISNLNKYTLFRGTFKGNDLALKNFAYYLYLKMKKKFPNDFNYMTESYFMPNEINLIKEKFKNYKQTKNNLWLCKLASGSLGIGIYFIKNYTDSLKCNGIITKYIHNPHLLNNKKYHLRLYLVITSIIPLKIYLYEDGQILKASHNYTLDLNKIDDIQSYLTNAHINENKDGYINDTSIKEIKELINNEGGNFNKIWDEIKDLSIKLILTNYKNEYKEMKLFNLNNGIIFRYYGLDILIDQNYKPWLLEANKQPYMTLQDEVNKNNKLDFTQSLLNLLGIVPYNHINGKILEKDIKCNFKNKIDEMINNAFCEFNRDFGNIKRIFPIKSNLEYYKKFIEEPGEENIALWNAIQNL